MIFFFFFFSSRRRHTRSLRDWSSDVCSSDLRPEATWWELSSKMRRRSSWASSHHASDFLIGISAARVDPARPSGSWRAASSLCSDLVMYRSLLVTPRRTQTASPPGRAAPRPSTTSRREAGPSGLPATVSSRSMLHLPVLPPTNATANGGIKQAYSDWPAGSGRDRIDGRDQAWRLPWKPQDAYLRRISFAQSAPDRPGSVPSSGAAAGRFARGTHHYAALLDQRSSAWATRSSRRQLPAFRAQGNNRARGFGPHFVPDHVRPWGCSECSPRAASDARDAGLDALTSQAVGVPGCPSSGPPWPRRTAMLAPGGRTPRGAAAARPGE